MAPRLVRVVEQNSDTPPPQRAVEITPQTGVRTNLVTLASVIGGVAAGVIWCTQIYGDLRQLRKDVDAAVMQQAAHHAAVQRQLEQHRELLTTYLLRGAMPAPTAR